MDWKVTMALGVLGVALVIGFAICLVTSVGIYARRLAQSPDERRRGFEVTTTTTKTTADVQSVVQREKDDHHG
jgi:hypothetical protein